MAALSTVYFNGNVFTAFRPGAGQEWAQAFVVTAGRFAYVGSNEGARAFAGSQALQVDLAGRFVMPGFIDGHAHILMTGDAISRAQLRDAKDLAQIHQRVRQWAEEHPDAPRVLGVSWLFEAVPDGKPTRQMLDEVVPDRPVFLEANDLHSMWMNTAALAEVGITTATPDIAGGTIGREADGHPNGYVDETVLQQVVWPFLGAQATEADTDAQLDTILAAYREAGTTGSIDMAFDDRSLAAIRRAYAQGRLTARIRAHWLIHNTGDPANHLAQVARAAEVMAETKRSPEADWLEVIGIKLIMDGTIDGCTSPMQWPYANGVNADPVWSLEDVTPVLVAADRAGLQMALHAIGDKTIQIALAGLEAVVHENGPYPRRHRIEHLELTDPADIPRLAALGVMASMQPVHADPSVLDNWRDMLGDERADRGFAWSEMRKAGARLVFGSDSPTAPYAPLPNMYIATTRKSALDPECPAYVPEFAVPLAEALRHGTADAAWSSCDENQRGHIGAGEFADFIVLDEQPFEHGPEALLRAQVQATYVDGVCVYEKE